MRQARWGHRVVDRRFNTLVHLTVHVFDGIPEPQRIKQGDEDQMKHLKSVILPFLVAGVWVGCGGGDATHADSEWTIDQRSYNLGGIGAFAEMVGADVKKLALSSPLEPAEMDKTVQEAERIAANHGVEVYRETDFLVTDLFASSLTDGKHVLLICHESTRQEYMDLKALKLRLLESGQYDETAREDIARRFGGLLSYSEEKIDALLASGVGS